jgi:fructose-bisphosphate aldolase class II
MASNPSSSDAKALKLKPGVVTGQAYQDLVAHCKNSGYALAAVNVTTSSILNAVLEAAASSKTDVIIQLSNGGAEYYAGKGMPDAARAKFLGAIAAAQHVHLLAQDYGVAVVLHTDHANKKLLPWVSWLLQEGEKHFERFGKPLFSSHMLDLSEEPLQENIDECARFLKRMDPLGMSLEIELGVTGGEEDGIGSEHDASADNAKLYTQPEDVLLAYQTLQPLGHFSVAASFGNVHGVYKPGNVKLRPEILKNSQDLVTKRCATALNPLNLVFHGGSGSEKEQIREAIRYGVFKMNIDTDTQFAYSQAVGAAIAANPKAFQHQLDPETGVPYKKFYDPRAWLRQGEVGLKNRLLEAFDDLGCRGRSVANSN